jgi:hypothetical protein
MIARFCIPERSDGIARLAILIYQVIITAGSKVVNGSHWAEEKRSATSAVRPKSVGATRAKSASTAQAHEPK